MKRTLLIGIFMGLLCVVRAQSLTSYTCDFENSAENALWELNMIPANRNLNDYANIWYIGPDGGFGVGSSVSSSGLYISSDKINRTSTYTNSQSVFISASRELQMAQGSYSVVFDWEALGAIGQDAKDGLYVFWVESGTQYYNKLVGNYNDRSSLATPPYVTNSTRYGGSQTWKSSAFTFTTAGNGGKLVVMWLNTLNPVMEPAGKVDNICIYPGNPCVAPSNVRYDGKTNTLSWNGNAASYDVMLYNYHTKNLTTQSGVTGNSMILPNLSEEGYYYIYVRSVNEQGHSVWVYTETFVWIRGARCIDLFDIGPSLQNAGACYVGEFDDFIRYDRQGTLGRVDNGSRDPSSMHTIHIDRNEIDPNTHVAGGLKTIPPGEIASIRLGAYTSSGLSARIEYKYTVQPGMSDLLDLQYAVVMESGNHGSSLADNDMNPTFRLNVLDEQGNQLGACSQRYFVAGYGNQSAWHQEGDIYWCDWSKVTVSLREYIGRTITIRLTSTRCSYDTHPAYAYFTMNCRGGDLQGVACGDFSTDHFEAPEGFNYRWYRADDPTKQVLSTDQNFHIERDDPTIYLVDVIDKNSSGCYYVLEANPNPRFPQAKARTRSIIGAQCSNSATFESQCRVVRINRQTLDSVYTDEPVETVRWDFGDGSQPLFSTEPVIEHTYPAEGGEFDVTVTASISGGVCVDPFVMHVSIPDITSPDTHEYEHFCEEGTDRADTTFKSNSYGCEYRQIKHKMYHPTFEQKYEDRICEGGRYYFPGDGKYYTASIDTTLELKSIYGCDSLISLSLIVDPRLEVEYPHSLKVCSEDNSFVLPYRTISGSMDSIHVYFPEEAQEYGFEPVYGFANGEEVIIPLPEGARPDLYNVEVEFGGERCQMDLQPVQIMLTYPTSIVMQNHGFIAIQNEDYNGGYKFSSYAWYKDGEKLDASTSYIPTDPSDLGDTFVLSLMREGENYAVETCPILYQPRTQGLGDLADGAYHVWPSSVEGGGTLWMSAGTSCRIYNVLGTVVASHRGASTVSSFAAPSQSGMYIVVFDNHQSLPIIVR